MRVSKDGTGESSRPLAQQVSEPGPATPPWLSARTSPEFEARKVLAERFARGDISSDEFMERASALNWTPGVEPVKPNGKRRKQP